MNLIQTLTHQIEVSRLWQKQITINRNEYLKRGGTTDTNLYFVAQGSLRIFVMDGEEEHTIRFGYQNSLITALDSFVNDTPSDFYIQAIKKTNLKVITKKAFMDFVEKDKNTLQLWHKILGQLICQQLEREKDLLTSSPLQRYQRVLERSPHLFQEIPNKYIASYLRMTPETLSRLKKV
ncbi:MAG TPA: Crp/Fnr family transcriptional regulator [Phaeodactylibacter sp.]|nr:Crp/Fnr family transcriptional regulator [Phaeodactylibacter sp.]